jgi:broad specificity polyphosphatase/5'/3'-nucleotidase SurE
MSIDVGRESTANLNENRQGIKSGQQIAAENGYDYEDTLEQLAIEAAKVSELAARYGVPETAIRLTTSSLPSTPAAAAAAGSEVGASAAAASLPPPETTAAAMQSIVDGVKGLSNSLDTVEKLENEIHEIGVFNGLLSGFNVSKK